MSELKTAARDLDMVTDMICQKHGVKTNTLVRLQNGETISINEVVTRVLKLVT